MTDYIQPELLALIPVLTFIGQWLKERKTIPDKLIPVILGAAGIAGGIAWSLVNTPLTDAATVAATIFAGLVQGVLCAFASVGAHQTVIKQPSKEDK